MCRVRVHSVVVLRQHTGNFIIRPARLMHEGTPLCHSSFVNLLDKSEWETDLAVQEMLHESSQGHPLPRCV